MATIHVQPITLTGWNDTRTSGIELFVFSSQDWVDVDGNPHGYGDINTRVWTQRVTGLIVNTTLKTLAIPMFDLVSTRDAQRGATVRYTFFIVAVVGNSVTQIAQMPNTENGIQLPATIASTSGCTPVGTCASWADILVYNSPSPSLPVESYPTRDEVNRLIAGITAGSTFAPVNASYLVQTAGGGLTGAQVMGSLATGLVKNTGTTGVQSIAIAGTDYQAPISVIAPLTFVGNVVAMPAATGSVNGYLTSTDWTTFNAKQGALGFTPENSANRNATNGYAGLTSGKLAIGQMQEVIGLSDLTDVGNALGTGVTVPKGTFAGITSGQSITWNGSDFVPFTPGTVTSVGVSTDAPWMTVASSPVTTTGTITVNRTTGLTANQFLGTPDGLTGVVGLRSIVLADIPTITVAKGGTNLTALGTAYQVLGVNSGATAAVYLSIVAGANVTVTPSGTQISIAAASSSPHNFLSATHPDTAAASATRGDIVTAQGSGTPLWARLAKGTQYQTLNGGANEPTWDAVHLDQATAVTGILPALNGGTGFDGSAAANGKVPIGNSTGFTLANLTAGSNITITNGAGSIQIDASGSLGTNWDSLTSPASANLALSMAAKTTTFTWGNATSTVDLFVLKDTASNSGTGHILEVNSAASSAAKPVGFFAGGTSNGVEMSTAGVLAAVGTGGITATALFGVAADGLQVRTSAGNFTSRSIAAGVGITVANGTGVSGNPTVTCDLSTLVASQTLWDSSAASRTLTFGLSGAADPVLTLSDGVMNLSTGTLQQGGTAVVLTSRTLTASTGLTGGGSLASDRTFAVDQAFSPTWTGIHTYTPTARSSGSAPYLTINAPADTALTADTEAIGVSFVGATRQHADGTTQTNQREIVFAKPTYSAAGTSIITNAATVAITGAPVAGTNMTLTNSWSFWVQGDQSRFDGVISQLTAGSVDPLTGPNLVGNQIVKLGTAASGTFSASGDYRQFQSYVINAGTANTVAGTFGVRMDGVGQGWALNPYSYANVSGATAVAIETNFGVLTSGGAAYGELYVVVGNFASTAFIQMQSGASGISATNGIVFLKGGAGLDPISGSAITFSGGPAMTIGMDFSGGSYSTGPFKLANNSFPVALNSDGTARIIGGMDSGNFMLFQSGKRDGGVRFLNAANTLNLFRIRDGGALVGVWFAAAQITANQDNYNPDAASGADGKDAYLQRWFSDASRNVTGLVFQQAQVDGQMHVIWNAGAQNIVLKHDTTSTAANRFLCSTFADITLAGGQAADVIYSSTNARWIVFKRN